MERREKIGFYYGVFLAVFTVFIGVLFIAEAADLYYSGVAALGAERGMYSRAAVGERLLEMLAPLLLWVVAAAFGVAVYALCPAPSRKGQKADGIVLCRRLRGRVSEEKNPDLYAKLRRMEHIRLAVRIAVAGFCLLSAVMCIVYLATASNFTSLSDLNGNILHMVANVFPWVGAALLLLIGETVFELLFARRMLAVMKGLLGGAAAPSPWARRRAYISEKIDNKYVIFGVRVAVFVLAVLFIGLGIWNGGAEGVLQKAIKICTECIGLG